MFNFCLLYTISPFHKFFKLIRHKKLLKTEEEKEDRKFATKIDLGKKSFECVVLHAIRQIGLRIRAISSLAGSEWVTANPELITKIILKGLKGEITVKGKKYGH